MSHTIEAACPFCGQVRFIKTSKDLSPGEAELAAIEECLCDGAETDKATRRAEKAVPIMFGPECDPAYGTPVNDPDTMALLILIAVKVATFKLGDVTIKLTDEQTAKFTIKEDHLRIIRERKRKTQKAV